MSAFGRRLDRRAANYRPLTPLGFLTRAVRLCPERTAVIHGDGRYSYRTFYERCVRLASALAARGVGPGDTVAILAPNSPAMLEAHYAVPMLGAVLSPINTRLDAPTVGYILDHGEANILLLDAELASLGLSGLREAARRPDLIEIHDSSAAPSASLGGQDYDALLAAGDPDFAWPGIEDEWQPISLSYTSGTTGEPKGVVYHHRGAYLTGVCNIPAFRLTPFPAFLWTLPMFHCNGWGNIWAVTAQCGTHICLRQVDPAAVFRLIDTHGVTHLCGAPIVLNMLVNAPVEQRRRSTHRVEYTIGGAPPPAALMARAEEIGFNLTHGYGLTETYGPAAFCTFHPEWEDLALDERVERIQRQGVHVLSQTDMTVVDPANMAPVPWDGATVGEIMVAGNAIMAGYLKNPEATEAAFADGWFHSGDLAVVHPDGYVEVRDRAKDIIISGGENISSIEVENALFRHPAVLEAAVVAKPDDKWGETPCAFVALKDGASADEASLIAHCRTQLAHFKCPKSVVIGPLPKTATGKVQKHVLRERAREKV
ncbi:MAG: long-chain-fatty-acid--CoA ligase [Alphaproteobacteria bacterium]